MWIPNTSKQNLHNLNKISVLFLKCAWLTKYNDKGAYILIMSNDANTQSVVVNGDACWQDPYKHFCSSSRCFVELLASQRSTSKWFIKVSLLLGFIICKNSDPLWSIKVKLLFRYRSEGIFLYLPFSFISRWRRT